METCELCGFERKLHHHHLTYVPEKIMVLCYYCHKALHMLVRVPEEKRIVVVQTMLDLIKDYSSHWTDDKAYRRSQYNRDSKKQWKKEHPNRIRESKERYRRTHVDSIKAYNKRYREEHKEGNSKEI